jgi:hypothetical protein
MPQSAAKRAKAPVARERRIERVITINPDLVKSLLGHLDESMKMIRSWMNNHYSTVGLFALLILVLPIGSGDSRAMQCARQPLNEVFDEADAIFAGRISAVHFLPEPSSPGLCWYDGVKCGEKIATVEVGRTWKGEVEKTAYVYSEDACYCLGTYFEKDQERLFIVKRNSRPIEVSSEVDRVDFQTAFCVRSTTFQRAVEEGVVDQLNTRFGERTEGGGVE